MLASHQGNRRSSCHAVYICGLCSLFSQVVDMIGGMDTPIRTCAETQVIIKYVCDINI